MIPAPPAPGCCETKPPSGFASRASLKKKKRGGGRKEKKFLQVEQSLCWIWEMLFRVTDKGNYLQSASSFSLISLLLCDSP